MLFEFSPLRGCCATGGTHYLKVAGSIEGAIRVQSPTGMLRDRGHLNSPEFQGCFVLQPRYHQPVVGCR
jgi:hypothetical protein